MVVILLSTLAGVITALILLIILLPARVQYIETIRISSTKQKVYDAIRYQEQLMEWSVWPKETRSDCKVANSDGEVGAQTIYFNKRGKKFGYQEITGLKESSQIDFYLKSYVAPFEEDVKMTFMLREDEPRVTLVILWFDEKLKKPHFLIAYFGGIIKWVHNMHLKDLAYLKKYVEEK